MSKMSELSRALDDLVACGEGLIRTANALRELFSAEPGQGTEPQKTRADPEAVAKPEVEKESKPGPDPKQDPVPDVPVTPEAPEEPEDPVQDPPLQYTFAEVRKAFTAKSRAGYTDEVRALISKYGAEKLSAVREEDYPALMADLETVS